ncbi:uncharacterized protein L969DRAFT_86613 [Mixia osmundae IAM 14324]|uniref:Eukaryotic translation initiation factor 4E n=1 Tax=Mixia osmundae (strain CBS 9802 / IAM 14324 / JCM 22182 / KY 12970) TaxID=764103 RepID=G7E9R3_MIXOS|nr:uncharacterized protein L969DRAFT_86613 [Mixia osmundae IAM 14324]KEI40013.1 hypothetical protein L969DRAFT_86613 [Mixia osmundae IAM 14324]GAA99382.1 hypothetical protein E5Q_06078 [Mixia osmundae IAM 14324]
MSAATLPEPAKAAVSASIESAVVQADKAADKQSDTAADAKADKAVKTVFDDKLHFNVVHPLNSTWTLWFDNASKQDKSRSWEDSLQQVMEINTVEEFWGLYNNIVPPSHIAISSNYYLFRKGIKPAWEDPANAKGGKWAVQLPRDKTAGNVDNFWLYTMLAAIGETFETPFDGSTAGTSAEVREEVTGVIISSRKVFWRINVWTKTATDSDKPRLEVIGKHIKYGILGVPVGVKLAAAGATVGTDVEFESHKDSMSGSRSNANKWKV